MADKNIQLMSENGVDNLFPVTKRFIDTSNIIASQSSSSQSITVNYTATEDCFFQMATYTLNQGSEISIDGVQIIDDYINLSGSGHISHIIPLKKGQTITASRATYSYKVFGLK